MSRKETRFSSCLVGFSIRFGCYREHRMWNQVARHMWIRCKQNTGEKPSHTIDGTRNGPWDPPPPSGTKTPKNQLPGEDFGVFCRRGRTRGSGDQRSHLCFSRTCSRSHHVKIFLHSGADFFWLMTNIAHKVKKSRMKSSKFSVFPKQTDQANGTQRQSRQWSPLFQETNNSETG